MGCHGTVVKGSEGGNACGVQFDGHKHISIVFVYDLELVYNSTV